MAFENWFLKFSVDYGFPFIKPTGQKNHWSTTREVYKGVLPIIYLICLETKKHLTKKWEVSIVELENHIGKKYKVTRRVPELSVAETKVFRSKGEAKKLFDEWLK